jgi:hypothetical protein
MVAHSQVQGLLSLLPVSLSRGVRRAATSMAYRFEILLPKIAQLSHP